MSDRTKILKLEGALFLMGLIGALLFTATAVVVVRNQDEARHDDEVILSCIQQRPNVLPISILTKCYLANTR